MNIEEGKSIMDCPICGYDYKGCLYNTFGRCIYRIAVTQQEISRACHHDVIAADIEDELNYYE